VDYAVPTCHGLWRGAVVEGKGRAIGMAETGLATSLFSAVRGSRPMRFDGVSLDPLGDGC
jgi:hypothetical protein